MPFLQHPRFRAAPLMLLLGLAFGDAFAQQAALVETDPVQRIESTQTSEVIGRVIATRQGDVAVRIDGSIVELPVAVGDRVEKGDVLARVDSALLRALHALEQANVELAKAVLGTREAELELARQEANRLARLQGSAASSRADYDDAVQRQSVKKAELEEARVEIRQKTIDMLIAEARIDYATVYAPYAGIVTARYQELGDYAQRGEAMFAMVGVDELELEANVFSGLARGLQPGTEVSGILDGEALTARVRAVLPLENDRTRTRVVRFSLGGDITAALTPGQSVELKLPSGPSSSFLSVHKDAVIYRRGEPQVFVVADGVAEPRPVTLGIASGNRFEVSGGLDEGEVVIVRGNERIQPGQPVTVGGTAQ